ncbi:RHS repeat-associated core domain-containing protein [Nitrosomonas sp.]|uniref:RHS repeat-associated core domain-containing protein n=1 Tax=Nitrosomonas sp. TaxID=42353 RepID=UPI001D81DC6F|nr:RHS repeat-associated core domain-containing protein [Nitrosomonas sp.]MBX3617112.1 hypothetical protein [Nitrosomonas sp.]
MIGEYRDNSNTATPTDSWLVRQETIWLGDIPVGVIKKPIATGPIKVHYVHADHLNTPRVIVDQANTVVWRWDNTHAFGANLPIENPMDATQIFEYNLHFPGQYFDKETNLHYNYFRYYEPETGRYISPDPIGLAAGMNVWGYVGQNPLSFVDPTGEILVAPIVIGGLIGAGIDLTLQLFQNGGDLECLDGRSIVTTALSGAALSGLGPTGFLLGRGGTKAASYGYSESAGVLNNASTRFGWGYRASDNSNVLRAVVNGSKTDIPGTAISPLASPLRDGAVSGVIGGGANRAAGDSCGCKK